MEKYIKSLKNKMFFVILIIILGSCTEKVNNKKIIKYNNKEYKLDSFFVVDIYERVYQTDLHLNVSKDTLSILEHCYDDKYMIWNIGSLNMEKPITWSLNNNCGMITIIDDLQSRLKSIDTLNNNIYWFDIELGYDAGVDSPKSKSTLIFSKEKGIICLIKKDSMNLAPFY
ncbi:hypothetical protein [Aureivirga sp. CE67]|uniref:hypothetical protein n=1 Tax=Aureivirga sp. CE67 TaxID=1788983 RepID=UPI0018CB4467|nr:hypothetical protein [Aureivirga sp. CE67]